MRLSSGPGACCSLSNAPGLQLPSAKLGASSAVQLSLRFFCGAPQAACRLAGALAARAHFRALPPGQHGSISTRARSSPAS